MTEHAASADAFADHSDTNLHGCGQRLEGRLVWWQGYGQGGAVDTEAGLAGPILFPRRSVTGAAVASLHVTACFCLAWNCMVISSDEYDGLTGLAAALQAVHQPVVGTASTCPRACVTGVADLARKPKGPGMTWHGYKQ